jgi:hypothetical protein
MNSLLRYSLLVVCSNLLSAHFAMTQDLPAPASQAPAAGQRRGPRPNPTNLQTLPKDIAGDEVIKIMRHYEADLGAECEFCHARNPETRRNDFASDANPVKDKARVMIKMTDDINAKYLTPLRDHKSTDVVSCGTCHRGMSHPEAFVPKPRENRPAGAPSQPSAPPATPQ